MRSLIPKRWIHRFRSASGPALPDELLIFIFDEVQTFVDTMAIYKTLISAQLVCKQWRRVAQPFLYSRVELVVENDATALENVVRSPASGTPAVDTLVMGLALQLVGIMGPNTFDGLLALMPAIRRLVILLIPTGLDYYTPWTRNPSPELGNLSQLSSLSDVTIMPLTPGWEGHRGGLTSDVFLRRLPKQIRFLQLPGHHATNPTVMANNPIEFQLFGLTIQEYPSSLTEWVLASSQTSLQLLTVGAATDLSRLANAHPNIRSLRILGPCDGRAPLNHQSFEEFLHLERLELRGPETKRTVLRTLPASIKHLEVWSRDLVMGMADFFRGPAGRRRLPLLQTVEWGYWSSGISEPAEAAFLPDIFTTEGIEFRMYRRQSYDAHPFKVRIIRDRCIRFVLTDPILLEI